jgi:hypothetical protein
MLLGTPKHGIASLSTREDVEAAIKSLESSNFPIKQVTVVKQQLESGDEDIAVTQDKFIDSKSTSSSTKAAATAGAVGGVAGILMGLGALMLPGIGSIAVLGVNSALVGMATGGAYGVVAGTLMGAALGSDISEEESKQYGDRLAQGEYLMIIEGSKEELDLAKSVIKNEKIEDWNIY